MYWGYSAELAEEVAEELKQIFQTHTFSINTYTRPETAGLHRPQCNVWTASLLASLANNFSFITAAALFFVAS